jgi:alcohol dehydrogenase (NADP+)
MITAKARATFSQEGSFELTTIERRELQPLDVLIEIKYAGICHSDIHSARGEWGPVNYPFVPGHEIAGIVSQIGSEVTKFSVGDRVGVGCMVDSCGDRYRFVIDIARRGMNNEYPSNILGGTHKKRASLFDGNSIC